MFRTINRFRDKSREVYTNWIIRVPGTRPLQRYCVTVLDIHLFRIHSGITGSEGGSKQ
jgi:hypothetical protein